MFLLFSRTTSAVCQCLRFASQRASMLHKLAFITEMAYWPLLFTSVILVQLVTQSHPY